MEVSKLTLSEQTAKQTSTLSQVLRWIQEHPRLCINTNIARLARQMPSSIGAQNTKRMMLSNMVRNQVLTRFGTKFNSRFLINYLHRDIPQEVLNNAPESEKETVKRIKTEVEQKKQTLTNEGVIVTPPKQEQTSEEIKPIKTPTMNKETNMKQSKPEPTIQTSKKDKQLTITININLEN